MLYYLHDYDDDNEFDDDVDYDDDELSVAGCRACVLQWMRASSDLSWSPRDEKPRKLLPTTSCLLRNTSTHRGFHFICAIVTVLISLCHDKLP